MKNQSVQEERVKSSVIRISSKILNHFVENGKFIKIKKKNKNEYYNFMFS